MICAVPRIAMPMASSKASDALDLAYYAPQPPGEGEIPYLEYWRVLQYRSGSAPYHRPGHHWRCSSSGTIMNLFECKQEQLGYLAFASLPTTNHRIRPVIFEGAATMNGGDRRRSYARI